MLALVSLLLTFLHQVYFQFEIRAVVLALVSLLVLASSLFSI